MPAKKLDIDNRDMKKSPIKKFMSDEDITESELDQDESPQIITVELESANETIDHAQNDIDDIRNRLMQAEEQRATEISTSMQQDEKPKYMFTNVLEGIVIEETASILKRAKNVCKCDKCFADVCALTLNNIKPQYTTTEIGEIYSRTKMLNILNLSEVTDEIFKNIDRVKEKPSH